MNLRLLTELKKKPIADKLLQANMLKYDYRLSQVKLNE